MKKHILPSVTLLAFMLTFLSCQKEEDLIKEPIITENSIEVVGSKVVFNWTVDYPGKIASVVEISLNADMSNSQRYGSESYTDDKTFTATAMGVENKTTFYYRYIVWNPNSSFECETKSYTINSNGLFSISPTLKVCFSKGNLQYQASTDTWRFAEHQYDVIGEDNSHISPDYSGWIDLFGWGTSGYNDKYPYMIGGYSSDYGNSSNDIAGTNYDWGVHNAISNGGNQAGLWRTLTKDEWDYVFNVRNTSSGNRYAKACVNGVNGVILMPDDWEGNYNSLSNYSSLNSLNGAGASFENNKISASQWSTLEQYGAIFLPAAGYRSLTSVEYPDSSGCYWSASCYYYDAYRVTFNNSGLDTMDRMYLREYGHSVRLVRSAQ